MIGERKVIVQSSPMKFGYNVYVIERGHDGTRLLRGDNWYKVSPDASTHDPTYFFDEETAKMILEQLLQQGVRPDDEAKREGEIKATKYHLEDLRNLLKLNPKKEL